MVGRDDRNADLLSRFVRMLRVKGVEDDRPINPELLVEREALSSLMAARVGAGVATVHAVGETDERGAYLALERGRRHQPRGAPRQTRSTTHCSARRSATSPRMHRVASRDMWPSADHLIRRADGSVCFLDFRWSELSATDQQLARDLAEMLTSLALRVGNQRVVAAARAEHSKEALAAALPFLQPTRPHADHQEGPEGPQAGPRTTCAPSSQTAAGVEKFEMVKLQRLSVKSVVSFFGLLFLANVLLLFAANWSEIWASLKEADYSKTPVMILFMLASYFGGTWALMGAVNIRLPFVRTTEIMFAQSFLNRFIPANAGGMALRMRYLQKNGVDLVIAAGSVGLTSAASGVMQVVMMLVFFTAAGRSEDAASSFHFPDLPWLLILLLLAVVIGIVLTTAFGKRVLASLKIQLSKLWVELRRLAKQPLKMFQLFGGCGYGKLMSIVMLEQSLRAFDVHIGFAPLGAMYITATTIAPAVPTPGGVGAIEAALTAGLVALGVDPAVSAAIVVYFRFISYWLPILPVLDRLPRRVASTPELAVASGTRDLRTRPCSATRRCTGSSATGPSGYPAPFSFSCAPPAGPRCCSSPGVQSGSPMNDRVLLSSSGHPVVLGLRGDLHLVGARRRSVRRTTAARVAPASVKLCVMFEIRFAPWFGATTNRFGKPCTCMPCLDSHARRPSSRRVPGRRDRTSRSRRGACTWCRPRTRRRRRGSPARGGSPSTHTPVSSMRSTPWPSVSTRCTFGRL